MPRPPAAPSSAAGDGRVRDLAAALLLSLLLAGCRPAAERPSGRVFPLPRLRADDALAVVTRPGGEGLQIWLDPDTSRPGRCSPRWNPDAARLRDGDGWHPRASGRAPRQEFYAAMARGEVRWQLQRQFRSLCGRLAPQRRFVWTEPPRRAEDYRPPPPLMLEEQHLLSDPGAVRRAEKRLLGQPLRPEDWREEPDRRERPGP